MVRKLVTILVCAALLAALAVTEQRLVSHLTDDALQKTQALIEEIRSGELSDALQKARALDQHWDEHTGGLETMVDHSSTDEVRYALSRLIAALEAEDRALALIYASELEGGIEHVRERQVVTPQNIL
ncbi:MAG: DUF4363 family protein [Clostridiales bacterium]|nr:DUF4363 family protein [Clostridiales bacterium]